MLSLLPSLLVFSPAAKATLFILQAIFPLLPSPSSFANFIHLGMPAIGQGKNANGFFEIGPGRPPSMIPGWGDGLNGHERKHNFQGQTDRRGRQTTAIAQAELDSAGENAGGEISPPKPKPTPTVAAAKSGAAASRTSEPRGQNKK